MSCPLYIRSVYSLLSSMCSIENTVLYAKKCGYKALGLVDDGVLSGAMSFKKACEKENIKPIFGMECHVEVEGRIIDVVLYAKNDNGFKNLMALSTLICTEDKEYINVGVLNSYRKDNILCLLSDSMPLTIAIDKKLDLDEALDKQNKIFKEYIVGLVDHDISINAKRDIELKKFLKLNSIMTIALSRTFYLNKDDNEAYSVLKCIREKTNLKDIDNSLDEGRYFYNQDEYELMYDQDDLDNIDVLVSNLNVELKYQTSLPKYVTKNDVSSKDYLIALCKEGLKRRLKNNISEEYKRRLDYELSVIVKMHFEDYFLIVYDFILYAKKNNILIGPGRGSAAGSLVAYCLGITDVDPIKYGLIFERFLNPERISMPDIDTDFPDNRRDEVIEYVKNKYGEDYVGHIITYGTLKAKQVIRDVARVLEIKDIDSIAKLIPNATSITLDEVYNSIPLFKQKIDIDEVHRKLFAIARRLEGNPRQKSTHPAGIVMSLKPLKEVVPLDKIEEDIYSTQYTMEHLEELGLIKMDFLSIRNLSIIAEIIEEINERESFDIRNIPLDDPKTFTLIDNVNVLGIFQLESSGMRNLISKMKPKNFAEIGMTIALFRPGPMKNIPTFLYNREHPNTIDYIHPNLKPILQETYGVIVYQEQIINIARVMANFTYGKADILRKAMSKKKMSELEKLYPDFIDGCINNGYSKELSEKVYLLILEFANYGFNKSHSIVYGMVAYQLAYLKANYPLYFYKALLNGVIGSASKTADYISECINIGQKIGGININESELEYIIKDNKIIMPLCVCKDVGGISAIKIVEERNNNGLFVDYISTVTRLVRAGVDKGVIEKLIYSGAMDCLNETRFTMKDSLERVLMYASAHSNDINLLTDYDDAPIVTKLADNKMVSAENEKEALGFYFTYNPILEIRKQYNIDTLDLYSISISEGYQKGFGMIIRVKTITTKKGDPMAFVDIEDDKGQLSLALMPNVYINVKDDLSKAKYVYFEGNMEKQTSCLVKKIKLI